MKRRWGPRVAKGRCLAAPLLEFYAATYGGFYQMSDTAAVVRRAKAALQGVETLQEYAAVTGGLCLYIGRMDYWVDLLIPWAGFGDMLEQMKG